MANSRDTKTLAQEFHANRGEGFILLEDGSAHKRCENRKLVGRVGRIAATVMASQALVFL